MSGFVESGPFEARVSLFPIGLSSRSRDGGEEVRRTAGSDEMDFGRREVRI